MTCKSFWTVILLTAGICHGARMQVRNVADEDLTACNTVDKCTSFDEKDKCSCLPYKESAELQTRIEELIRDTMQRIRKIQDKLAGESNLFQKLWWGSSLGEAQKQLLLLEQSVDYIPAIQDMMSEPVFNLTNTNLPAGVWPIMVEIWDDNYGRQTFVGETGVPFKQGEETYVRELGSNAYQNAVNPKGAKVHFSTSVHTKGEPYACTVDGQDTTCVKMEVAVTCLKAEGLPNTDTGIYKVTGKKDLTDAYCKVRVNTNPGVASEKYKTEYVPDSLNPVFDTEFKVPEFEVAMIEDLNSEEGMVQFTMEQLTLSEQVGATMQHLASEVFLNEDKCKSSSRFQAVCRLVQSLGAGGIDKKALQDLSSDENPALAQMASRLAEESPSDSLLQLEEEADLLGMATTGKGHVHMIRRGRRAAKAKHRRYGGNTGGHYNVHHYHRHGGGGKGGGRYGLILFMMGMCLLLILL